jgi:hypothetical protein
MQLEDPEPDQVALRALLQGDTPALQLNRITLGFFSACALAVIERLKAASFV